jgi:hypothetical protein
MTHRYPFDEPEYLRENRELVAQEQRDDEQRLDEEWKLRGVGGAEEESE